MDTNQSPFTKRLKKFISYAKTNQIWEYQVRKLQVESGKSSTLKTTISELDGDMSQLLFEKSGWSSLIQQKKVQHFHVQRIVRIIKNIVEKYKVDKNNIDFELVYIFMSDLKENQFFVSLVKVLANSHFIDCVGNEYCNWNEFLDNNHFPPSLMCVPKGGTYGEGTTVNIQILCSPSYKRNKKSIIPYAATSVAGLLGAGGAIIASGGLAILAASICGYALGRLSTELYLLLRNSTVLERLNDILSVPEYSVAVSDFTSPVGEAIFLMFCLVETGQIIGKFSELRNLLRKIHGFWLSEETLYEVYCIYKKMREYDRPLVCSQLCDLGKYPFIWSTIRSSFKVRAISKIIVCLITSALSQKGVNEIFKNIEAIFPEIRSNIAQFVKDYLEKYFQNLIKYHDENDLKKNIMLLELGRRYEAEEEKKKEYLMSGFSEIDTNETLINRTSSIRTTTEKVLLHKNPNSSYFPREGQLEMDRSSVVSEKMGYDIDDLDVLKYDFLNYDKVNVILFHYDPNIPISESFIKGLMKGPYELSLKCIKDNEIYEVVLENNSGLMIIKDDLGIITFSNR